MHHFKVFVTITYGHSAAATAEVPPPRRTIRRFSAEAGATFAAFCALLEAAVLQRRPCGLSIAYKDGDGDVVEVTGEAEWQEALALAPLFAPSFSTDPLRTIPLLVEATIVHTSATSEGSSVTSEIGEEAVEAAVASSDVTGLMAGEEAVAEGGTPTAVESAEDSWAVVATEAAPLVTADATEIRASEEEVAADVHRDDDVATVNIPASDVDAAEEVAEGDEAILTVEEVETVVSMDATKADEALAVEADAVEDTLAEAAVEATAVATEEVQHISPEPETEIAVSAKVVVEATAAVAAALRAKEEARSERLAALFYDGHPVRIIVTDVFPRGHGPTTTSSTASASGDAAAQLLLPRVTEYPHFSPRDEPMLALLSLLFDCEADIELLDPYRRLNFGALLRRTVDPFGSDPSVYAAATGRQRTAGNSGVVGGEGSSFCLQLFHEQIRRHVGTVVSRLLGGILSRARRALPPCAVSSSQVVIRHRSLFDSRSVITPSRAGGVATATTASTTSDASATHADAERTVALLSAAVQVFPADATLWYHFATALAASARLADAEATTSASDTNSSSPSSSPSPSSPLPVAYAAVGAALGEALQRGYADVQQLLSEPLFGGVLPAFPELGPLVEARLVELFAADCARPLTYPAATTTSSSAAAAEIGSPSSADGFVTVPSPYASAPHAEAAARSIVQLMLVCPLLTSVAHARALLVRHGDNVHAVAAYLMDSPQSALAPSAEADADVAASAPHSSSF